MRIKKGVAAARGLSFLPMSGGMGRCYAPTCGVYEFEGVPNF
ncbi:hypothetical protein [Candidatus Viridilinea mediisalina]|nr:hypothetical protein [Candidatus Viridilinea mediisalina]